MRMPSCVAAPMGFASLAGSSEPPSRNSRYVSVPPGWGFSAPLVIVVGVSSTWAIGTRSPSCPTLSWSSPGPSAIDGGADGLGHGRLALRGGVERLSVAGDAVHPRVSGAQLVAFEGVLDVDVVDPGVGRRRSDDFIKLVRAGAERTKLG